MPYTVTLLPSEHSFKVEEGQRILAAGLAAGNSMPYSCRQGVCNTCKGRIVSGTVDYGDVHPAYFSEADRNSGFALLCQATPISDCVIEVKELEGLAGVRRKVVPCRVTDLTLLAPDVFLMRVRLPMNENMMFVAGQFVEFMLKDGIRRNYSITVPPSVEGVRSLEFHIRHLPGGRFTDRLFAGGIKVGEVMRFEGPDGSFYLRDSNKPAILLASGTGFGPIKAMLQHAGKRPDPRHMTLYWGGRSKRDLYMFDLAQGWERQFPDFRFVPVLSEPNIENSWTGRAGLVHQAVMDDFPDLSGHQVYACGAPIVVEAARSDFSSHCGLPSDEFFADSFITEAETHGGQS